MTRLGTESALLRTLLLGPADVRQAASSINDSELISFCQREGLLSLLARSADSTNGRHMLPAGLAARIRAQERRLSAQAMRVEGIAADLQQRLDALPGLQAVFCGRLFHRHRYPGIPLRAALDPIRLLVLCDDQEKELHVKLGRYGFRPISRLTRYQTLRRWLRPTLYRRNRISLQVSRRLDHDADVKLDDERIWKTRQQQITPRGGVCILSQEYALLEQILIVAHQLQARKLPAFVITELFFMLRTVDATLDWPAFFAARAREGLGEVAIATTSTLLGTLSAGTTIPALATFLATSPDNSPGC